MTEKLIQSYVLERYFVSTAYRRASTAEPMYYYETIVWEWDKDTKERGEIIETADSSGYYKVALENHLSICQKLSDKHEEEIGNFREQYQKEREKTDGIFKFDGKIL